MTIKLLIPLAIAIASCSQAQTLERQKREEGIYTVGGDPKTLSEFHQDIGRKWTGGEIVDADSADGTISYWAYPTRTAAEARALMMPVMMSGLELGIVEYFEANQFKDERKVLDDIAIECGAKVDPFFLTPMKSVQIAATNDSEGKLRACLLAGVEKKAKLPIWAAPQVEQTP